MHENKLPPYCKCQQHPLEREAKRRRKARKQRRITHRAKSGIVGSTILTAVILEGAHCIQHLAEGNWIAALAITGSWMKDGVLVLLEHFVTEEEDEPWEL